MEKTGDNRLQLFIIGNGFDRGHGLNTSYWDFRNYLENMYPNFLQAFEEHYSIYPANSEEAQKNLLWNELEKNLANIDEEIIIEDALGMDMALESGDVGIEDTLYEYFTDEYNYIQLLAKYLKQWVRTIKIRDVKPKTTKINNFNDAIYITFNYTAVLENVYKIKVGKIIHIHGSLREYDIDPVLGHGNKERIKGISNRLEEAEKIFDEKEISICKVIKDYYENTYKDVSRYIYKLLNLIDKDVREIIVIGHSVAGVDLPYFKSIDIFTQRAAMWNVYYFSNSEKQGIYNDLIKCEIDPQRIIMKNAKTFYDM